MEQIKMKVHTSLCMHLKELIKRFQEFIEIKTVKIEILHELVNRLINIK